MPSELDKQLILQPTHDVGVSLVLLGDNFIPIEELQGRVRSMTANISATSDIRRTCSVVMGIIDGSFSSENFEVNWLDKLVEVSIGLLNGTSYEWYLLGTLLLDTNAYSYDATTNDLTLSLVDMMAAATDVRGSQIGSTVLVPYEANVRNALIATVARFSPFVRYDVVEFPDVIPYDQEFDVGTYAHAILSQIVGLFPYYEMYYSADGYFTVKQIPTGIGDPLLVDKTFMDAILIKENRTGRLGNIKNSTEIWGAELDATYAATSVSTILGEESFSEPSVNGDFELIITGDDATGFSLVDGELIYNGVVNYSIVDSELYVDEITAYFGSTYVLTHSPAITTLEVGADYLFVPDSYSSNGQKIKVDALDPVPLYNSDGSSLPAGAMSPNRAYVVRYLPADIGGVLTNRFLLQGEWQVHVITKEVNVMPSSAYISQDKINNNCDDIRYIVNPDSPYACDRNGMDYDDGEIRQVFSGGDYSMIHTTELAYQRAAYETWLKTRLQTDTEIECLLVPWMDVNKKIEYTSPVTGIARQYMVKEVTMNPAEFAMTLKLSRFYPYYPWL